MYVSYPIQEVQPASHLTFFFSCVPLTLDKFLDAINIGPCGTALKGDNNILLSPGFQKRRTKETDKGVQMFLPRQNCPTQMKNFQTIYF